MLILLINRILGNNVEKDSNYENGFNFENSPIGENIFI
jgi:hypothetical protein